MNQYHHFLNLPAGWCFAPDDEQLLKDYLIPKVRGLPLKWDGIVEKLDLYGVGAPPPWEIFHDIDSYPPSLYVHTETNKDRTTTRKTVYVFTKLKAAASNSVRGVRVARRAGGGTWSGKSKPKKVIDSATGNVIGITKQFAFQHEGVDEQAVGHWIMHEYSLSAGWGNDFVLCKISRCTTHPAPQLHAPPAIVDQGYFLQDEGIIEEEVIILEPHSKRQKTDHVVVSDVDMKFAEELEHGEEGCSFGAEEDMVNSDMIIEGCSFGGVNMLENKSGNDPDFVDEWDIILDNISDEPENEAGSGKYVEEVEKKEQEHGEEDLDEYAEGLEKMLMREEEEVITLKPSDVVSESGKMVMNGEEEEEEEDMWDPNLGFTEEELEEMKRNGEKRLDHVIEVIILDDEVVSEKDEYAEGLEKIVMCDEEHGEEKEKEKEEDDMVYPIVPFTEEEMEEMMSDDKSASASASASAADFDFDEDEWEKRLDHITWGNSDIDDHGGDLETILKFNNEFLSFR